MSFLLLPCKIFYLAITTSIKLLNVDHFKVSLTQLTMSTGARYPYFPLDCCCLKSTVLISIIKILSVHHLFPSAGSRITFTASCHLVIIYYTSTDLEAVIWMKERRVKEQRVRDGERQTQRQGQGSGKENERRRERQPSNYVNISYHFWQLLSFSIAKALSLVSATTHNTVYNNKKKKKNSSHSCTEPAANSLFQWLSPHSLLPLLAQTVRIVISGTANVSTTGESVNTSCNPQNALQTILSASQNDWSWQELGKHAHTQTQSHSHTTLLLRLHALPFAISTALQLLSLTNLSLEWGRGGDGWLTRFRA